jgi:hypothetical protein
MIDPFTLVLFALLLGDDDTPLTKANLTTEMRRNSAREARTRARQRTNKEHTGGEQGLGMLGI